MVTKAQIKKIHTLKSILGLDEELYREMLSRFGAGSCKDLSQEEGARFIELMEVTAIGLDRWQRPQEKFKELAGRSDRATPAQLRKIEAMWCEFLQISTQKEVMARKRAKKSLRALLQRLYKISDLRFLQREDVSKVLNTIQTMINQQLNKN